MFLLFQVFLTMTTILTNVCSLIIFYYKLDSYHTDVQMCMHLCGSQRETQIAGCLQALWQQTVPAGTSIGQHSLPVHILDPLAWKRHMATDNQEICSGIRETPFKDLALPIKILAMCQKFEECSKFNYVLSRFLTC